MSVSVTSFEFIIWVAKLIIPSRTVLIAAVTAMRALFFKLTGSLLSVALIKRCNSIAPPISCCFWAPQAMIRVNTACFCSSEVSCSTVLPSDGGVLLVDVAHFSGYFQVVQDQRRSPANTSNHEVKHVAHIFTHRCSLGFGNCMSAVILSMWISSMEALQIAASDQHLRPCRRLPFEILEVAYRLIDPR